MRGRLALNDGFALIELLVVVLIMGILAAIAIPSFLGQSTANGAPSKSLMATAVLTAQSAALESGYTAINAKLLQTYEPTIATSKGKGPWVSAASGTTSGYTLTVTSAITGNKFTMKNTNGAITRTCTIPKTTSPAGGCTVPKGKTSGTW